MARINRHERTRRDHTSETAEDYVEAIFEILARQDVCRNSDLARHFAVSPVTSSKIVSRLVLEGLVESTPYGPVALTDKGERLAKACQKRHLAIVRFLLSLGVSPETAEMDAEGIEHHVSDETLACFRKFTSRSGPTDG